MGKIATPLGRHRGIAHRTIPKPEGTEGPGELIIGVVYDPSVVPAAKLDELFDDTLEEVWDEAQRMRRLTLSGAGATFDPWEAVARMEARHPGDVLPHPQLRLPHRLRYPRWLPTAEELEKVEKERVSLEKGRYIQETGDWAVDGEGGQ